MIITLLPRKYKVNASQLNLSAWLRQTAPNLAPNPNTRGALLLRPLHAIQTAVQSSNPFPMFTWRVMAGGFLMSQNTLGTGIGYGTLSGNTVCAADIDCVDHEGEDELVLQHVDNMEGDDRLSTRQV
jgi:hypothetical protein